MEIIAGKARGLKLRSPEGAEIVRPTSVRARKALFDSLGDLSGLVFADLFAGSGAVGLEAASRGAEQVIFVDAVRSSSKVVLQNCERVKRTGVTAGFQVLTGELPAFSGRLLSMPKPDLIFADPPYEKSAELLDALTGNEPFTRWADGSQLIWELPDAGCDLLPPKAPWRIMTIKSLGPARFLILKIVK